MAVENSILDHPEYKRLQALALGDLSQQHRTFNIYLDLIETKGWYNVKLFPVDKLQTVFVSGHPTSTDELCIVWPLSTAAAVSMHQITTVMHELHTEYPSSRLMMGIVDSDSTVVYYRLTDGVVPPDPPQEQQAAKERQRRKMRRRRLRQQHFS